jgi:UDP-glucuronate 4-epimerase
MSWVSHDGYVLVTGAAGHLGRAVVGHLSASGAKLLATDLDDQDPGIVRCDLRHNDQLAKVFESAPVETVIHLAGVLPSAFHADPLGGASVNLTGSLNLLQHSVAHQVKRFVFASSVSVYGLTGRSREPYTEEDSPTPDEAYGASKRAIEAVGQSLSGASAMEFVALRIARVIGPGIKRTSSPWREQILEARSAGRTIAIPYAPDAKLCLLHVDDAASMLVILAEASAIRHAIYNTPAEIWTAQELKHVIEKGSSTRVELGQPGEYAGATCDGTKFVHEFGFHLCGLRERLLQVIRS